MALHGNKNWEPFRTDDTCWRASATWLISERMPASSSTGSFESSSLVFRLILVGFWRGRTERLSRVCFHIRAFIGRTPLKIDITEQTFFVIPWQGPMPVITVNRWLACVLLHRAQQRCYLHSEKQTCFGPSTPSPPPQRNPHLHSLCEQQ